MSGVLSSGLSGVRLDLRGAVGRFAIDAAFETPERGVTVLFGPSGAGKTTLLRAVAGLERLKGEVRVGREVWQDARTFRPPHLRPVGCVFQEPSLLANLSVRGNLEYGMRRSSAARPFIWDEVVEMLRLAPLLKRRPDRLSGGEAQRVAIGRALMRQPSVLLMDEPLSGLDRAAKAEILTYLETLKTWADIPILYVTHDAEEAARLADAVVRVENGRVAISPRPLDTKTAPDIAGIAAAPPSRVARLALAALAAGLPPLGED